MNSALLYFGDTATIGVKVVYQIIRDLMCWAVPCFVMLTGALLLDSDRIISTKKLWKKYIARMVIVLMIFGTFYSWLEIVFSSRTVSFFQIPQAIVRVLTGNTWAHMWYIYCLIGLYLLLPVYKLIADYASDAQLKYILFILFVVLSLFPLTQIWGVELGFYCHLNKIYPFYLLLGVAWNRGLITRKKRNHVAFLISSSIFLIVASVLWVTMDVPVDSLCGYSSFLVIIQSVALFSLFNSIGTNNKWGGILERIGDKSFGIYLVHMVFVNLAFQVLKFNPFAGNAILWGGYTYSC